MGLPKGNMFYGFGSKLTQEQREFIDAIFNKKLIFCNAKAGTGKTTMAVAAAKYIVDDRSEQFKHINGLLYVFNPTEEDAMGHRPGDQNEKEAAYLPPLKDALIEIGDMPDRVGNPYFWVEAKSHTFVRGSNTINKVVIIDEAQNWTKKDLRKMLTRLHDSCIGIVIGHTGQIDLVRPSQSGFAPYIKYYSQKKFAEGASIIELTKNFRGWIAQTADAIDEEEVLQLTGIEVLLHKAELLLNRVFKRAG